MMTNCLKATIYIVLTFSATNVFAQQYVSEPNFWSTPTIQGYGKIHMFPHAEFRPNKSETYNIVFSITKGVEKPDKVNTSLDHVARTLNLYVAAGVPLSHLHFVAIAYGDATPLAISNSAYNKRYGTDNPNLKLIYLLSRAGVKVAVCGQAVAEHKFSYEDVDKSVLTALSGLTTVTTLEHQGYDLMPL